MHRTLQCLARVHRELTVVLDVLANPATASLQTVWTVARNALWVDAALRLMCETGGMSDLVVDNAIIKPRSEPVAPTASLRMMIEGVFSLLYYLVSRDGQLRLVQSHQEQLYNNLHLNDEWNELVSRPIELCPGARNTHVVLGAIRSVNPVQALTSIFETQPQLPDVDHIFLEAIDRDSDSSSVLKYLFDQGLVPSDGNSLVEVVLTEKGFELLRNVETFKVLQILFRQFPNLRYRREVSALSSA